MGAVIVTAFVVLTGLAAPAGAYSQSTWRGARMFPYMYYQKNNSSTLNSKLTAYLSMGRTRYRISMRGGSGDGTRSDCVRNKGQLPSGYYDPRDRDRSSTLKFNKNKYWGEDVVKGAVWELGNKRCKPTSGQSAVTRTELFIHSQGRRGWNSRNYRSAGCIKINQVDRAHLAKQWPAAYMSTAGYLLVY